MKAGLQEKIQGLDKNQLISTHDLYWVKLKPGSTQRSRLTPEQLAETQEIFQALVAEAKARGIAL